MEEFKCQNLYCIIFISAPKDHLIVSNRSYAYACLDQYDQALSDAELTVQLKPDWPKVGVI